MTIPRAPVIHIQNTAPGPPRGDRSGNSSYVSCANGGRKCCRQCLKVGNLSFILRILISSTDQTQSMCKFSYLKEPIPYGEKYPHKKKKYDQRRTPNVAIDFIQKAN